jgi:hypothetical protein
MQSPQDSLTHEAAALFRLVDSIDRFVAEQQNSYTYTDSTETFFRKIRADAEATKKVISNVVQESARRPEDIERRYPGRPIGQLILLHVARKHDPNARVKSTYFGPVYPEAPPFKNPEEDLLKIGIRRTSIICKGTIENGQFTREPRD